MQFAVPSVALTPAVMPKGGMREVSTVPEVPADADVEAGAEAAEVTEVATVRKVLGVLPPPP